MKHGLVLSGLHFFTAIRHRVNPSDVTCHVAGEKRCRGDVLSTRRYERRRGYRRRSTVAPAVALTLAHSSSRLDDECRPASRPQTQPSHSLPSVSAVRTAAACSAAVGSPLVSPPPRERPHLFGGSLTPPGARRVLRGGVAPGVGRHLHRIKAAPSPLTHHSPKECLCP